MFIFVVLTTTGARSSNSFTLSLYMKTIRAKQAKVDFTYQLCTTRPTWNNRKPLDFTQSSSLLRRIRCSSHFSFLNSLIKTMSTIARATSENVNSQLFQVIMLAEHVLSIMELNWNQRLRDKKTNLLSCCQVFTSFTQRQKRYFMSSTGRDLAATKCTKMKNAREKRKKLLFFIVKYANLWHSCFRPRLVRLRSLCSFQLSTKVRTSFENVTSGFCNHSSITPNCLVWKMSLKLE